MIRKLGLFLLVNGALLLATLLYEVNYRRPGNATFYDSTESTSTTINLALRQAKEVSMEANPMTAESTGKQISGMKSVYSMCVLARWRTLTFCLQYRCTSSH